MVSVASLQMAVEESFAADGGGLLRSTEEVFKRERCLGILKEFNQRMVHEIVEK